jgi:membrane fusion protein, copper/silver efflux system
MTLSAVSRSPWLWAALAFVLGSTTVALTPRAWLFVEAPTHLGHDAAAPKEVWACPMGCVKLDGPGICPVCGMDLEELKDTGDTLLLNARERALIDLQTSEVSLRPLDHTLRTFGRVGFNQRRVERISAWVSGRITRLFSDTVYTNVRQGDHLFELYSPELYATQSEYLAAISGGSPRLAASARQKLLLLGFMEAQILALEAAKEPQHTLVIHSPAAGTIFELMVREGDYVKEGTPLYTIADYDTLWLSFDAYESDLPWIAAGQDVELTFESQPGQTFQGVVEFIDKAVNEKSRTLKVRVVLDNTGHLLSPGMFATVVIHAQLGPDGKLAAPTLKGRYHCYMHPEVHADQPGDCPICGMPVELHPSTPTDPAAASDAPRVLSVPKTAVLDTGARQLIYVMSQPPHYEQQGDRWVELSPAGFEAREVTLGPRGGDFVAVIHGLKAGERVATHGNFLIDSQMELLGKPSLLHPAGSTSGAAANPHAGH